MEIRQNTSSVMARLMGLDELQQPKRCAQKPRQVISETYLQRLASVGVGKKRSNSFKIVESGSNLFHGSNPKRKALFSRESKPLLGESKSCERCLSSANSRSCVDNREEFSEELSRRTRQRRVTEGSISKPTLLTGIEFQAENRVSERRNINDTDRRRLSKQQAKYEDFRSKWCLKSKSGKTLNLARINIGKRNSVVDEDGSGTTKSFHIYGTKGDKRLINIRARIDSVSVIPFENYENVVSKDDDDSAQREASIGSAEERSTFLHCSKMELDSLVNLEEPYQPSPISVLEPPFIDLERVSSDIYDLGLSETSETNSEGPGMAVSSDDECEEEFTSEPAEENESFNYLVEVIRKASLRGKNLVDLSTWDSLENPMSISVFETLEKKCYDRIYLKRSERRLLFDRVNAGLVELFLPRVGVSTWKNPVLVRFDATKGNEMVEEVLWSFMVAQENKCGLKENVLGSEFGKLDLGDEILGIGSEIEGLLFHELVEELFY